MKKSSLKPLTRVRLNGRVYSVFKYNIRGAFHLTCKTGIASIATVAVNGKRVASWRFW